MAKPLCMNDTNSDANQYSGPIPLIGLYIAGATSVCLLLILLDTIAGIRRKNLYIPCRFFSINSATLTLIGVASKLSVDLTTYMPSARDQLSKLTGTTMVCICIGFFMPALGANRESESIANMIALSLLVITIFVNICIQMSTRVIFSFMVEHIVILCCMLTLLFMLWCSVLGNRGIKSVLAEQNKFAFRRGWGPRLIDRLKIWYINGRAFNPQLIFCDDCSGVIVDIVCILCLVVVSQAAFRSLILDKFEFCRGISDYGWSMWMIIITQIVTIILGGLTIGFRWLALILLNIGIHYDNDLRGSLKDESDVLSLRFFYVFYGIVWTKIDNLFFQFSFMKTRSVKKFIVSVSLVLLRLGLLVLFILIFSTIALVPLCLSIILVKFIMRCCPTSNSEENRKEYDSLKLWLKEMRDWRPPCFYQSSLWMGRQCVKDMNKWINSEKEGEPTKEYVVQMLSKRDSSSSVDNRVSCLFMVVLVKILSVSIRLDLTKNLRHTLKEAFKIIYFIDESVNAKYLRHRERHELAELLWTSGDFDLSKMDLKDHPFGSMDYVISVVKGLIARSQDNDLDDELQVIRALIEKGELKTVEELRDYSEKLFAGMLHSFLAQLPIAIYKEFNLSPVEEYEERAEHIFKLLCELHPSLEEKVHWVFPEDVKVFPEDVKVSSFFDFEDRSANSQTRTTQKDVGASTSYDVVPSNGSDVETGLS